MAKRILVFQDQIRSLCGLGRKYRVIGGKGGLVLLEETEGVSEEPEG